MVIMSVGISPENKLAREAGLELCEHGHILVNAAMLSSDANIYAVGDAVCIKDFMTGAHTATALAGPANKQARIAADNALGRKSIFRGTLGTSVVKVFDLTVAATGANEKQLKTGNIPYLKSYTHSGSHASYYPGAEVMSIKLLFSPSDGKILGGQIIGKDGVDKRIDVIATAIRSHMTINDLEELELAYAPPYSSAKDPVNVAGFVASNILNGDMEVVHWDELGSLDMNRHVLIDLRNMDELEISGRIEGAVHIPLHHLPRQDRGARSGQDIHTVLRSRIARLYRASHPGTKRLQVEELERWIQDLPCGKGEDHGRVRHDQAVAERVKSHL